MKIAVLKLGARISFGKKGIRRDTSAGTGEILHMIRHLKKAGADVDIWTKILVQDDLPDEYDFYDIETSYQHFNDNEYDAILVSNGNVNYFGGKDVPSQTLNYHIINHFTGKVFYMMCDPALQFRQLWGAIAGKPWADQYKQSDIEVTRDDIILLSQSYNLDVVRDKVLNHSSVVPIKPDNVVYFPFNFSPCIEDILPFNESPEYDLSYGGTHRGTKRNIKLTKYYYGYDDIVVELFGKLKHDKFKPSLVAGLTPPKFGGAVRHSDMQSRMNNSVAHVVIGDSIYEELNLIPQRVSESIWARTVNFIDTDMDKERIIYQNGSQELKDFLYVSSREEVNEKINKLKNDTEFRRRITDEQIKAYGYTEEFGSIFIDVMKMYGA